MQTQLYIDGEFVPAESGGTVPVVNPHDDSVIAEVADAGIVDVDRAVTAAETAFSSWRASSTAERSRLLLDLAAAIDDDAESLARLESLDTGHPVRDTSAIDVPRTSMVLRYFAGMADKVEGSVIPADPGFLNYVVREPIGVVGQIVPWNFPLMFTAWKLGPALAGGNCVVLKPSELTPLTTLRVTAMLARIGVPRGVVNVIPGRGAVAGQRLAEHRKVGKLAFTGSTEVGRRIVHASAGNLKRLQLELGGKGANIVFADADLDAAVQGSAFAIFHNQGQACIAGSRLILHESVAQRFLDSFLELAESIRLGNPLHDSTEMGPLTTAQHRDRVLERVRDAAGRGATVLCGGKPPADPALRRGFYVTPTVLLADFADPICQEEIFGPVVTVCTFSSDDEALTIANGTRYGLGAGLWTRDLGRAHRVASLLRSGMVWINCYKRVSPASPFGGVGESGYGREMGFEVMREYTQAKSVWVNVDGVTRRFYGEPASAAA